MVVSPRVWNKDVTEPPGATVSPDGILHDEFFAPLVADLRQAGFSDQHPRQIWRHVDRSFPSPLHEGIWYMASLGGGQFAWVTLHISTHDSDLTKRIFNALKKDQQEIESTIMAGPSAEWEWRRHNPYYFSEINVRREGSIADPPEQQDEIRAWMRDLLPKFKDEFDPRIQKTIENFQGEDTKNG